MKNRNRCRLRTRIKEEFEEAIEEIVETYSRDLEYVDDYMNIKIGLTK